MEDGSIVIIRIINLELEGITLTSFYLGTESCWK